MGKDADDMELGKHKLSQDSLQAKKKKHPGCFLNTRDYLQEYTAKSGLHGASYLGEPGRSLCEKLTWGIVYVISLYLSAALIIDTYNKWDNSPVIVSFAQSPTPVWQIPFPAVTICPETKSRQSVYNFTKFYHMMREEPENVTAEDLKKFHDVTLVCDSHLYNEGNETTDFNTIDFLSKVAPQFDETLWSCKWTNLNETCNLLYTPVLTDEGSCFTFNMLDRDDIYTDIVYHNKEYLKHGRDSHGWSLEHGYGSSEGKDTFPRRALSSGADAGLTMLMRGYEYDLDYVCKGPVQGFKILLHHPGEIPRVSSKYFRLPLNEEMILSVKPEMITTSESLRNYDPRRRQCYFGDERHLKYFKNYTQENCEMECRTNYTLNVCDCVAYHMPHEENTQICGPGKILCMKDAANDLLTSKVNKGISTYEQPSAEDGECDCLPACTSLEYNAETSQAAFDWPALFQAFKANMSEFPGIRMARLTIFFKEMQFITSERNELYGLTDFLANCGGLLGLFMGFSFLSIVEVFYFMTFRMFCNIKRHGRHFWSGSPELLEDDAYVHND